MSQLTVTFDLTAENLEKLKAFCQEAGAETVSKKPAVKDKKEEQKAKAAKQTAEKEAKAGAVKTEEPEQETKNNAAVKPLTTTDVRAVALKISKAGMSDTLKDIFKKFGASKLSEVPEERYNDLMAELMTVEVDKNA